jgi:hypothetical protein
MSASQEGLALTIGDQQQVVPMTFPDQETADRLRARLNSSAGKALSVRITPAQQSDVEGHAFDATLTSVWLNLQLEGDDTEGHAISVRFPTAADADKFRRNLLAAGILAGAIVIGSAGAIAVTSHPATSGVSAPIEQSQVYQRPAVHGVGVDDPVTGGSAAATSASTATGINPATGKPWRSGLQERADAESSGPADAALPRSPAVEHPAGSRPLETAE